MFERGSSMRTRPRCFKSRQVSHHFHHLLVAQRISNHDAHSTRSGRKHGSNSRRTKRRQTRNSPSLTNQFRKLPNLINYVFFFFLKGFNKHQDISHQIPQTQCPLIRVFPPASLSFPGQQTHRIPGEIRSSQTRANSK